ncbi:hypothetical protein [Halioxenophilus sp. WMMB6]|uniref:hypothetical protein n=1 Tax=Halioxenophilus sp. WMMB6 TaxID=3073815 RepID=UPI00295EDA16|nr:hypothetical protein [Halioxenophilus sp. WMMB6]
MTKPNSKPETPSSNEAFVGGESLEGYSFINQIDRNLRVVASLNAPKLRGQPVELRTQIFYQNEFVATLNFFLHEYSIEECIHLAQNIRENDYLVERIDEYLAGDVVE